MGGPFGYMGDIRQLDVFPDTTATVHPSPPHQPGLGTCTGITGKPQAKGTLLTLARLILSIHLVGNEYLA